jgi:hypothetical protein
MEKPPTLEYQTRPKRGNRQRTASLAICIGVFNLLWVSVPLTAELGAFDPRGKFPILPSSWTVQDVIWVFVSVLSGICYIIGGAAFHRPHRLWETTTRACAAGQVVALLILIGWTTLRIDPSNHVWLVQMFVYVFQTLCVVSLLKQLRRIGCDD